MSRIFVTVLIAAFALVTTAFAQEVPYYEPRNFADAPFYANQIVTSEQEQQYASDCKGSAHGPPYYYASDPDGATWEGNEDPGNLFFAEDPCGLRTVNLSGVWKADGGQLFVVSHNPRSGAFSVRYLYTPPDAEPRKTWGTGLEGLLFEGRIHDDDIWLDMHAVFPPIFQNRCPDQANTIRHVASVKLNYVAAGRFKWIEIEAPRLRINNDCSVNFMEKNYYGLSQLDLVP